MTEKQKLLQKIAEIENDPNNQTLPGSFWKYKKPARVKLDKLYREIASIIRAEKIARGETVNDAGYSGRNSNKP